MYTRNTLSQNPREALNDQQREIKGNKPKGKKMIKKLKRKKCTKFKSMASLGFELYPRISYM